MQSLESSSLQWLQHSEVGRKVSIAQGICNIATHLDHVTLTGRSNLSGNFQKLPSVNLLNNWGLVSSTCLLQPGHKTYLAGQPATVIQC